MAEGVGSLREHIKTGGRERRENLRAEMAQIERARIEARAARTREKEQEENQKKLEESKAIEEGLKASKKAKRLAAGRLTEAEEVENLGIDDDESSSEDEALESEDQKFGVELELQQQAPRTVAFSLTARGGRLVDKGGGGAGWQKPAPRPDRRGATQRA